MNEPAFRKLLRDIKSSDIAKVEDSANAVCALKDKDSLNLILKTLEEDDNPLVKRVMLWALRNYSTGLDYFKFLRYLADEDMGVREAALVLFMDGGKSAIDVLVNAVDSDDLNIRYSSVQALGQFRSPEALPALISAASSDNDEIREIAVMSVGVYADALVTPVLINALSDSGDIALAALSGLKGRILKTEELKAVEKLLSNDRDDIRAACVYVLDAACPDKAGKDESSYVRRAFASVTASKNILAKLCSDADSSVRTSAADSIGRQKFSLDDVLIPMLKDEIPGVRRAAASALGNSSGENTINALIECLSDVKPGIRAAAAASLGKIGGERAVSALKAAMKTKNPILAGIIKNALAQAEGKKE
ncbi:MAG: HEAT repeat domain-containing protein [Methanocorpusculum sp.]|nr:HEAT repeat domain-containing protein [Methanocorpusculum sp.]